MSNENPFAKWPHIDAAKQSEADSSGGAAPRRELPGSTTDGPPMSNQNALENFLGGTPASVFVKLLFISLVVGALLMWLDIRPGDIFRGIQDFLNRIYALGFGAVRELFNYVIAGAVIVVPIWFILRLLNVGGRG